MGSRDHSITCEKCGAQRGGLNDYKCRCDEAPRCPTKRYAKKREPICAVQWLGGENTPELLELLGQRGHYNSDTGQLELGHGWYVRVGDWICSASGEDFAVIGDEVFRSIYEEVDATGRAAPPTENEHGFGVFDGEIAAQRIIRELDVLLLASLKLSREEHPAIFRDRDSILRKLRRLLEDQAYTAARRERHRIRNLIAKELTP